MADKSQLHEPYTRLPSLNFMGYLAIALLVLWVVVSILSFKLVLIYLGFVASGLVSYMVHHHLDRWSHRNDRLPAGYYRFWWP
jgi:multisubunit Na+/H+ antiporter MnhE subunit